MARTPRTQKNSKFIFSLGLFHTRRNEISIIEKRIRFLERKLIKMVEINPHQAIIINQNIERLTELLAHKKADRALAQYRRATRAVVANLPPVIHDLGDAAAPGAGAPAAVAAAPAEFEAQAVEMINPEWGMVTPVAQVAPAFPNFDEHAIPSTPQDQIMRTPENPPALEMHARVAPLFWLAPAAIAVPATPQAQIMRTPENPPALVLPPRFLPRFNVPYTPPHRVTRGNPTEPPRRERAPRMLPTLA